MRVRGRGNEQAYDSASRLAAGFDHRAGEATIARRHRLIYGQRVEIYGQRVEALLQDAQTPQSLAAHVRGLGDEDSEVQLRE